MYAIFTYIWLIFMANVGVYSIQSLVYLHTFGLINMVFTSWGTIPIVPWMVWEPGNQFAAGRWSYPLPTWLLPLHPELSAMQVDSVEG